MQFAVDERRPLGRGRAVAKIYQASPGAMVLKRPTAQLTAGRGFGWCKSPEASGKSKWGFRRLLGSRQIGRPDVVGGAQVWTPRRLREEGEESRLRGANGDGLGNPPGLGPARHASCQLTRTAWQPGSAACREGQPGSLLGLSSGQNTERGQGVKNDVFCASYTLWSALCLFLHQQSHLQLSSIRLGNDVLSW